MIGIKLKTSKKGVKMERKKLFSSFFLILVGLVFGVVLVTGFNWVKPAHSSAQIGSSNPLVNVNQDAQRLSEAFIQVANAVTPIVVYIEVKSTTNVELPEDHDFFFKEFPFFKDLPKEFEQPQVGSGSGVIISSDGYIVTNNHVVKDAKTINVILNDKRKFSAELIGTDPLTDLAVIKIDAKNLTPAYLGNSDELKVGQWVLAIGNPLGLTSTVTAGIVSALGRGGLRLIQDSYGIEDFIQTDAAINPGNSGGALVDLNGAVIGINTAIASRTGYYQGYGFAIPINIVKTVAKDLIEFGKVKRGYIGVQIREVDDAVAKAMGLGKTRGVIVEGLVEGGAAKDAGIEVGDVILSVDGKEVDKPNDLQGYIAGKHAGDKVKLQIFRDGKTFEKEITLRPRKEDEQDTKPGKKKEERKIDSNLEIKTYDEIGLTVKNMSSSDLKKYNVENGILITKVEPLSISADAGLQQGLVIVEVNKKKIDSVKEFDEIISKKKGSAILLRVRDVQGNARFVGLEIPK